MCELRDEVHHLVVKLLRLPRLEREALLSVFERIGTPRASDCLLGPSRLRAFERLLLDARHHLCGAR